MATGTVKWFNESKGYGFITPDQGGEDLFAHFSAIQGSGFKTLQQSQKVSYDVTTGPKGKQATNIRPEWPARPQDRPMIEKARLAGLFRLARPARQRERCNRSHRNPRVT